jgi:hypothetical protein
MKPPNGYEVTSSSRLSARILATMDVVAFELSITEPSYIRNSSTRVYHEASLALHVVQDVCGARCACDRSETPEERRARETVSIILSHTHSVEGEI